MFGRILLIAATALMIGIPATAQERGTIELGGFGSHSSYDSDLGIDNDWGGGFRVGAFIFPRLSVEFDLGQRRASRPHGLASVDVEAFTARLTAVPLKAGPLSLLVGAGVSHTDWQSGVSDGLQGLVGLKVGLGSRAAFRVDGTMDWNDDAVRNQSLQMGVSLYRHPGGRTTTVTNTPTVPMSAAPQVQQRDSVSAAETRRMRAAEADLRALRDSLANRPSPTSASALATMEEMIHFAHDRSDLDGTAMGILRAKVPVFRADPSMRIVIVGFASEPGTDRYNMALGMRRAEAARAYLISQGIDAGRIDIATRGSGELLIEGPGEAAHAANRRSEFRVQLTQTSQLPGN